MRLAWGNLNYDRLRFGVTIIGIAFAVFLMVFQGSLLTGFIRASSRVIDAADADLWITAKGVPCFEFATPVPGRFRELALGVEGVSAVYRITTGVAVWQKPSGMQQIIQIIGSEPGVGKGFPLPYQFAPDGPLDTEVVVVDQSNAVMLEGADPGAEVEINKIRATVNTTNDFGSFYGQPYVFTSYRDSLRYLGWGPDETQFLTVHTIPGSDIKRIQHELQTRLPEVNVHTPAEFSRRAQIYWNLQTGAGSALLTAALLGFIVGVVVVAQTIYATTIENLEEFATLKAIGATRGYIQRVVMMQALFSGIIGSIIGLAVTVPLVGVIRGTIPWVYMPWWLPVGMIGVSLLMCSLASVVSVKKAVSVEPGRVFRA